MSSQFNQRLKRHDLCVILFILLVGVFQIATVQIKESFGSDSSVYIVLSQNIRDLGRYDFNHKPHTLYPPGFPLILASLATITGGSSYEVFIRFMPAFSTLALLIWYFILKRAFGRGIAGAACAILATAAPLYELVTRSIVSDPSFFLTSGLALWCLMLLERPHRLSIHIRTLLLISTCLAAIITVLLRSAGVALCLALIAWTVAEWCFRGPRRLASWSPALIPAILGFMVFLSWVAWTKHAERIDYTGQHMASYASQFMAADPHRPELGKASAGAFLLRLASNVPIQGSHIASLALRAEYILPTWYSPLTVAVLVLLVCGLASCAAERRMSLLAWYFLAYFSLYLLWPFDEGPRFMLPVAPLAFTLAWVGLLRCADVLRRRPDFILSLTLGLSLCLTAAMATINRPSGLQARAASAFWPTVAITSGLLLFVVRRTETSGIKSVLDKYFAMLRSRGAQLGTIAVAALVGVGLLQTAGASSRNHAPDVHSFRHHASADFALWLMSTEGGVVMAQQSAIVHRLTGRKVIDFPITSNPSIIVEALARGRVRYVAVNDEVKDEYFYPTEEERLRRVSAAYPSLLRFVHRGRGFRVFEHEGLGQ
jgi:hypothetical protein